MSRPPLRLILLSRDHSERIERSSHLLAEFLSEQPGTEVLAAEVVEELDPKQIDQADLIVVLGGDGAILRACRKLGHVQRPIVGVNLGRLGFLADLSPSDFVARFEELRNGQFEVVEHLMFQCTLRTVEGREETFLGLNETAVSAAEALQMVEVSLAIDDQPVTTYSCDGLLISTPVGSTAHSLSAGGPAIRPDLPVFVVTPICPHTLSNRALVDDANRTYKLSLPNARTDVMLVIDGQIRRPLRVGDEVEICKADVTFKLAKLNGFSFYDVLRTKMGWSGQPRYSSDD
jgi:NAD+ kinase